MDYPVAHDSTAEAAREGDKTGKHHRSHADWGKTGPLA
jgi:hypothetical protein